MESMEYPGYERNVEIMEAGDSRQEEHINFGPIDDSWMGALGNRGRGKYR